MEEKGMTSLYDFMLTHGHYGGCDCYDAEFDVDGVCMIPIPIPEVDDSYDMVQNWILQNTEFVSCGKEHPEYNTVGDFSGLVRKHLKEFKEFTKDRNKPMYAVRGSDDDSIYNGVATIMTLAPGGYADEDYDDFVKIFKVRK